MDAFQCPHCNQALETGKQEQDEREICPHCGELLVVFQDGALVVDDSILQSEQGSTVLLSEKDTRKTNPESDGTICRKEWKEIVYAVLITLLLMCSLYSLAIACLFGLFLFSPSIEQIRYFFLVGSLCAFTGIVAGHLTHYVLRKALLFPWWRRFAEIFTPICYVILVLLLGLVYLTGVVPASRQTARKVSCQNNLKQIYLLLTIYYHENGSLPPLLSTGERLIYTFEPDCEMWISSPCPAGRTPHLCPHDKQGNEFLKNWVKEKEGIKATLPELKEIINMSSYMYLGYVVTNDEEMRAFAEAYKECVATGMPFDTDLEVPPGKGTDGGDKIIRLKKIGIEASSAEERENLSKIPIVWERCLLAPDQHEPTFFHVPRGINVMFLDGHCEFIPYGDDRWPLTEETMRLFWELENL